MFLVNKSKYNGWYLFTSAHTHKALNMSPGILIGIPALVEKVNMLVAKTLSLL